MALSFLDRARGCLVGGAVGDALGYAVEFISLNSIRAKYGPEGIQAYDPDYETGTAIISDDTQMTLFTANGLLLSETRGGRPVEGWIYEAYLDWLKTQQFRRKGKATCWLNDIPELNERRAPGNTCLQALGSGEMGWVDEPINNSKGCGGVMRVAPVAIYGHRKGWELEKTDRLGAAAAAITHGHSLGWMSAAAAVDIMYRIFGGEKVGEAVEQSISAMETLYAENAWMPTMVKGMRRAVELTQNAQDDVENIESLGGGWVGDEALYIAIYCAVKYADDLDAALIAAVNHSGDSDSTGVIVGNILGAHCGYEAISSKWKNNLELSGVILEIADDLCASERDGAWLRKYSR